MIAIDVSRVIAVVRKELRDYRRKRSIVVGMLILPAIFLIEPVLAVFLGATDPVGDPSYRAPLLLLLLLLLIELQQSEAVGKRGGRGGCWSRMRSRGR